MSFFEELKRRNVFRVGLAYVVASWLLLQITDVLVSLMGLPEFVGKVVVALVIIGFIPVMAFSWVYEVTPEGIKRESEVERSEAITRETAARLNRTTIVLLVAVAAMVVADRFLTERGKGSESVSQQEAEQQAGAMEDKEAPRPISDTAEKSVAVLPFVNMSSDPEQEFFSDGISEEILNVLTRIPNLKVAARTSSFQFKGQNRDIADIARQLKVNHVLEGSVRKAGNQLRITAQLIEAESGYHLWSDTYDRRLEDVFAIQDEIAGAIAGELRTRLSDDPIQASKAVDVQAYQMYLKGLSMVATRNEEELFGAFDILKSAIDIEPEYASAMATLAKGYAVAPYFTDRLPAGELREEARSWADKALQLEPDNAEALAVMGVVANESDLDSDKALELLRKAVQSNPGNLAANNFLGDVLFRTGAVKEAVVYESRAAEIDPLAPVHLADLAFAYFLAAEYEKVLELTERALELNPAFDQAHEGRTAAYWAVGDLRQLELALQTRISANKFPEAEELALRAKLDMARGAPREARKNLLASFQLAMEGQANPVEIAFSAAVIGDFDMAGELLLHAYAENIGNWTFPLYVRLPEQAPDSSAWQEFWSLPEPARLAEMRRANDLNPHHPAFGEGASQ